MKNVVLVLAAVSLVATMAGFASADEERPLPEELPRDFGSLDAEMQNVRAEKATERARHDDASGVELYLGAFLAPLRLRAGDAVSPDPVRNGFAVGLQLPELRIGVSDQRTNRAYVYLRHLGGVVENQMLGFGYAHVFGNPDRDDVRAYLGFRSAGFLRYLGDGDNGGFGRIVDFGVPLGLQCDLTSFFAVNFGLRPSLVVYDVPDSQGDDGGKRLGFQTLAVIGTEVTL